MASLYLTLRGTAVMYYGEEIGMENNDPKRPEDVKDSMGKHGMAERKGARRRAHADAMERGSQTQGSARPLPGCRWTAVTQLTTSNRETGSQFDPELLPSTADPAAYE